MIPLIFEEPTSLVMGELPNEDYDVATWWGTWIECSVTLSRLRREEYLDEGGQEETRVALDDLSGNWLEVEPTNELRLLAMLVSSDHPLKAADCLQLAAALRWCEGNTDGAGFICLDNRLRQAAREEGFHLLPESERL